MVVMQRDEFPLREQLECADVMYGFRDLIQKAWMDDLPKAIFGKPDNSRFDAFRCLGLVDGMWNLKDDFRKVVSEVIGNRTIEGLTRADCGIIASRHREWYPHAVLGEEWRSAGYDLRSAMMRGVVR